MENQKEEKFEIDLMVSKGTLFKTIVYVFCC